MKYKLLIAEDVCAERTALCHVIRKHLGESLTIFEAIDGCEALELYQREIPDIVLLNIEMPGLSGLEVARKIRETNITCAIFFISDFDNFSYAKQAIELRALDYILKPFDEDALIHTLTDVIHYLGQLETIIREIPMSLYPGIPKTDDIPECTRLSLVRKDINNFIETHYMEELSMKNAARAMNYSDAYFCKLFKQCFHMNFSSYLNEYRIEKAKAMIENSRVNVKEVGRACGYTDPNYFSRVFKKLTGQTPTEYRLSIMDKTCKNKKK